MGQYGGVKNEKLIDEIEEAFIVHETKDFNSSKNTKTKTTNTTRQCSNSSDLFNGIAILWAVSPLLLAALISIAFKDFSENNPLLLFLICASPIIIGIMVLKRSMNKTRRSK